jgi:hypothetical protein
MITKINKKNDDDDDTQTCLAFFNMSVCVYILGKSSLLGNVFHSSSSSSLPPHFSHLIR